MSCDQPELAEIDMISPLIEIVAPERETIYAPADTVFIKALVSDNTKLRKASVHIHDLSLVAPADTVFVCDYFMNLQNFAIDTFWVVNEPSSKTYLIIFDCVDQAENGADKLRYFHQRH